MSTTFQLAKSVRGVRGIYPSHKTQRKATYLNTWGCQKLTAAFPYVPWTVNLLTVAIWLLNSSMSLTSWPFVQSDECKTTPQQLFFPLSIRHCWPKLESHQAVCRLCPLLSPGARIWSFDFKSSGSWVLRRRINLPSRQPIYCRSPTHEMKLPRANTVVQVGTELWRNVPLSFFIECINSGSPNTGRRVLTARENSL